MGPLPVLMVLVIYHGRAWYLHSVVPTSWFIMEFDFEHASTYRLC